MKHLSWRNLSLCGAVLTFVLWPVVELAGQIESIAIVNRVSFVTAGFTFIAAWRSDVPTKEDA